MGAGCGYIKGWRDSRGNLLEKWCTKFSIFLPLFENFFPNFFRFFINVNYPSVWLYIPWVLFYVELDCFMRVGIVVYTVKF